MEDTEAAFEAADDDTTLDALRAPDAGSEGAPEFREPAMPEEEAAANARRRLVPAHSDR